MNFDKAFNRILWRFQECKTIRVNDEDIKAINKIVDYVNKSNTQNFNNNIYFAKLYAFSLGSFLERYNTTLDNPIPHKQLHELLNRPFGNIVSDIASKQNVYYQYKILEEAGCSLEKHPSMIPEKEKKNTIYNLEKLIYLGDNKNLFLNGAWSVEEVERGIKEQISNFINGI